MSAEPALHSLLARRWSPTVFDPSAEIGAAEVEVLLEAAPVAADPARPRRPLVEISWPEAGRS